MDRVGTLIESLNEVITPVLSILTAFAMLIPVFKFLISSLVILGYVAAFILGLIVAYLIEKEIIEELFKESLTRDFTSVWFHYASYGLLNTSLFSLFLNSAGNVFTNQILNILSHCVSYSFFILAVFSSLSASIMHRFWNSRKKIQLSSISYAIVLSTIALIINMNMLTAKIAIVNKVVVIVAVSTLFSVPVFSLIISKEQSLLESGKHVSIWFLFLLISSYSATQLLPKKVEALCSYIPHIKVETLRGDLLVLSYPDPYLVIYFDNDHNLWTEMKLESNEFYSIPCSKICKGEVKIVVPTTGGLSECDIRPLLEECECKCCKRQNKQ